MEMSPAEVHFGEAAEKMIYYTACCLSLNTIPTESKGYDESDPCSVLVLSTRHTGLASYSLTGKINTSSGEHIKQTCID